MNNGQIILEAIGEADVKYLRAAERRRRFGNIMRHVVKSVLVFILSLAVLTLLYFILFGQGHAA